MFTFEPKIAVIPGKVLISLLSKENISQKELALKTGLSEKHISNIIQGKASITEETAIKFEYVFGGQASFWINLQKSFDEISTRLSFEKRLEEEIKLVKNFPCKELASYNFIAKVAGALDKVKELLKFFAVASLKQIKYTQAVAYHQTAVKGKQINQNAVAAYLRIGDIKFKELSEKKEIPKYVVSEFKKVIPEVRELTGKKDFFDKLPGLLWKNGVVLLYSPYLPKTYISGSARWIGGHPVIQINDHLKSKDSLLFTIFHEFAHVLLHNKQEEYLDYDGGNSHDKEEKEADAWASETLIKKLDYERFLKLGLISSTSIKIFSNEIKVSKDVLIGRLAYDGKISWRDRARLVDKVVYGKS